MSKIEHSCDNGRCKEEAEECFCSSCLDEIKDSAFDEGKQQGYDEGYEEAKKEFELENG